MHAEGEDIVFSLDPWRQRPNSSPPDNRYQPHRHREQRRRSPSSQHRSRPEARVTNDDELSQAASTEFDRRRERVTEQTRRDAMQAANSTQVGASSPTFQMPGFMTPPQAVHQPYIGIPIPPALVPSQRTSDNTNALFQLYEAQHRMIATRTAAPTMHRPHVIRHNLPISSAAASSAAPIASVTTPTPPPSNSFENFHQAVTAMEQFRQRERENRQQSATASVAASAQLAQVIGQMQQPQTVQQYQPQDPLTASQIPQTSQAPPPAPSADEVMRDAERRIEEEWRNPAVSDVMANIRPFRYVDDFAFAMPISPQPGTPPPGPGMDLARIQTDEVIPHFYDGVDDACTICSEPFEHGERVCRLACRHMFHAQCWEDFQRHHLGSLESIQHVRPDCPNCRGSGTLIAIWKYITTDTTQMVDGIPVANELDRFAAAHTLGTPTSTPPHSPRQNSESSVAQSMFPTTQLLDATTDQRSLGAVSSLNYHVDTRLADGRHAMVIDIGSVGNLCGDQWAKYVAKEAAKNGETPSYVRRPKPLQVRGVGTGSQECPFDCKLPISLKKDGEDKAVRGTITLPSIPHSMVPGLMGLKAMEDNRTILDITTGKMYFCGPGNYDLLAALPSGTDVFQMEKAPSGHLVLPCCEYKRPAQGNETLTLWSRNSQTASTAPVPRTVPPPPSAPPSLPASVLQPQTPAGLPQH